MGEEIKIDEEELERLDKKLSKKNKIKASRKRKSNIYRCQQYIRIMGFTQKNITQTQKEFVAENYGLTISKLNDLL